MAQAYPRELKRCAKCEKSFSDLVATHRDKNSLCEVCAYDDDRYHEYQGAHTNH